VMVLKKHHSEHYVRKLITIFYCLDYKLSIL